MIPGSYTAKVQETESGEMFIELPPELLESLGWKEGDEMEWIELPLGGWAISKAE